MFCFSFFYLRNYIPIMNNTFICYVHVWKPFTKLFIIVKLCEGAKMLCGNIFSGFFLFQCPIRLYGVACNKICGNCRNNFILFDPWKLSFLYLDMNKRFIWNNKFRSCINKIRYKAEDMIEQNEHIIEHYTCTIQYHITRYGRINDVHDKHRIVLKDLHD